MDKLTLVLIVFLAGCSTINDRTIESYVPYAHQSEVLIPQAFDTDLVTCRMEAKDWSENQKKFDPVQIALEGSTGALSDLGELAITPAATALSGLGRASGEGLEELGVSPGKIKKFIAICMHDKGVKSGAYAVYDPDL